MGWGKTFLAGLGGFVVAGPVGAAIAAGAAHAGSKIMQANEEAKKEEERTSAQAASNDQSREKLMQMRAKRLEAQKKKEEDENLRIENERKKAEAEAALAKAKANAEREQLLIAFIAVGVATASVDGAMSAEEKHELMEVLDAIKGEEELPAAVEKQLKLYEEKAPTFMQAKKEVCKLENPDTKMFRSLIENIIHSDNEVSPEEEDFLDKWDYYFPEK